MAYGIENDDGSAACADEPRRHRTVSQHLLGGLALAGIALGCGWMLYANLVETPPTDPFVTPSVTIVTEPASSPIASARSAASPVAVAQKPPVAPKKRSLFTAPVFDIALIDPKKGFGLPPTTFSRGEPAKVTPQTAAAAQSTPVEIVASVPLPTPRPAGLGGAPLAKPIAAAVSDPFEKLLGKRQMGPELAYAPADGGVSNSGASKPSGKLLLSDGFSAIYDITGRVVHLPDGTKLEAHSGLGPKMDDPRHVNVRMHGATPPHVYDLAPREALFHGVEALRLHPVGGAEAIHGRTGLLTHTYLLGPRGDSNGCISFKDYDAFLRAYKDGKVKRMIVVASLDDPQFDLTLLDRPITKRVAARTYSLASEAELTRIEDDRYALVLNAAARLAHQFVGALV